MRGQETVGSEGLDLRLAAMLARAHSVSETNVADLPPVAQELIRLSDELSSPLGRAWGLLYRGRASLLANSLGPCLRDLTTSLGLFTDHAVEIGVGRARALLGSAFDLAGDVDAALEHLNHARAVQRRIGDLWGEARTINLYGRIFSNTGRYREALEAFDDAERRFEELGDQIRAAMTRANRARTVNACALDLLARGNADAAEIEEMFRLNAVEFEKLIDASRMFDNLVLRSRAHAGLGHSLAGLGRHVDAADQLVLAAALAREVGDEAMASDAEIALARSMVAVDARNEALDILSRVVNHTTVRGLDRVRSEAYKELANVLASLDRAGEAFDAFRIHHDLEMAHREATAQMQMLAAAASFDLERLRIEAEIARREVEELEADARDRSKFIAAVAHELRHPLTAVHGFALALESDWQSLPPDQVAEMIGIIASQAVDGSNIVEDLLAAAGVTNGTLRVIPSTIDLVGTIQSEVTSVPVVGAADGLPPAVGDAFRVRQIVRNLVSNARRYGGDGIRAHFGFDDQTVWVEVRDDGDGIPFGEVEAVFEAFTRSRSGRQVSTSMGLGLPISRQLARLMDGDLVYERIGEETAFRLTLPRAEA
jgi:signal transduction histidine kinase